jgi:hypothetical protein
VGGGGGGEIGKGLMESVLGHSDVTAIRFEWNLHAAHTRKQPSKELSSMSKVLFFALVNWNLK